MQNPMNKEFMMLDDLKDRYRFRSIEDEGNDPAHRR